jgi:hypothetical protein
VATRPRGAVEVRRAGARPHGALAHDLARANAVVVLVEAAAGLAFRAIGVTVLDASIRSRVVAGAVDAISEGALVGSGARFTTRRRDERVGLDAPIAGEGVSGGGVCGESVCGRRVAGRDVGFDRRV